jgi:predicted ester cyclase
MANKVMIGLVLGAALAATGCKAKDEDPPMPPPDTTPKVEPPKPEVKPEVKPLTGADLAKAYVDCWNDLNTAAWDKLAACYSDEVVSTNLDSGMPEAKGPQAVLENNGKAFKTAFPDLKGEPQLVLVNGRQIVGMVLVTGTQSGTLRLPGGDLASNGKIGYLMVQGVEMNDANQASKEWFLEDFATLASQLGKSSMPARPVLDKGMEGAPTIVVATDSDTEKMNVEAWKAENQAFNAHDAAAMAAGWADTIVDADQADPADAAGKAKVTAGLKAFFTAFPDGKLSLDQVWGAGDYVVAQETFTGTNTGPLGKAKKTGKAIDIKVVEIARLDGGKVTQMWRFRNGMAIAQQLGLAPTPPAPKTK